MQRNGQVSVHSASSVVNEKDSYVAQINQRKSVS